MKKKLLVGNWKMHLTLNEAQGLVTEVCGIFNDEQLTDFETVLAVPSLYAFPAYHIAKSHPSVSIGIQNVHTEEHGAYTGEISAKMAQSCGVKYVLTGHSERRMHFKETNKFISEKLIRICSNQMIPILCVGETLFQKQANKTNPIIKEQLRDGAFKLVVENFTNVVIAYEPVWSIGTGNVPSLKEINNVCVHIRELISKRYNNEIAQNTIILYGGSVNESNAAEIFSILEINGALVGGASLKARHFANIAKALQKA